MIDTEKIKLFETELQYIKNESYRESAQVLLSLLPDYFFKIAASSTGKYHPSFSLGEGGLVRHTKVAIRIAYEILGDESIGNIFSSDEKDLILIALLLHDGAKEGIPQGKYTVFDHPLVVSNFIKEHQGETSFTGPEIELLISMIESHMGPWNTNAYSNVVLPKPRNRYQKFVHMCDFLSSRKFLDVKFEQNEIQE